MQNLHRFKLEIERHIYVDSHETQSTRKKKRESKKNNFIPHDRPTCWDCKIKINFTCFESSNHVFSGGHDVSLIFICLQEYY